jgi:hypothetical protein
MADKYVAYLNKHLDEGGLGILAQTYDQFHGTANKVDQVAFITFMDEKLIMNAHVTEKELSDNRFLGNAPALQAPPPVAPTPTAAPVILSHKAPKVTSAPLPVHATSVRWKLAKTAQFAPTTFPSEGEGFDNVTIAHQLIAPGETPIDKKLATYLVNLGKLARVHLTSDLTPADHDPLKSSPAAIAHGIHMLNALEKEGGSLADNAHGFGLSRSMCVLNNVVNAAYTGQQAYKELSVASNQPVTRESILNLTHHSGIADMARLSELADKYKHHRTLAGGVRMAELTNTANVMVTHEIDHADFKPRASAMNSFSSLLSEHGDARIGENGIKYNTTLSTIPACTEKLLGGDKLNINDLTSEQLDALDLLFSQATYYRRRHDFSEKGLYEAPGRQPLPFENESHMQNTEATVRGLATWKKLYTGVNVHEIGAEAMEKRLNSVGEMERREAFDAMTRAAYAGRVASVVATAMTNTELETLTRDVRSAAQAKRKLNPSAARLFLVNPIYYNRSYPDPESREHVKTIIANGAALGFASLTDGEVKALAETPLNTSALRQQVNHYIVDDLPLNVSANDMNQLMCAAKRTAAPTAAAITPTAHIGPHPDQPVAGVSASTFAEIGMNRSIVSGMGVFLRRERPRLFDSGAKGFIVLVSPVPAKYQNRKAAPSEIALFVNNHVLSISDAQKLGTIPADIIERARHANVWYNEDSE